MGELAKKLLRSFAENLCGNSDPERVISALETCTEFGEDFYSVEEKSVSDRAYYLIEGVIEVLREKLKEHGVDVLVDTLVDIWNDSVKSVKKFYGVELSPITVENPEKLFDETVNELERELDFV